MAERNVVFVNNSNVRLKFSYRYGLTASKIEYLETLAPGSSFTYKVRDDGTFEKIEVDYLISSEGSEYFKPTNLKINADTMSKYMKIHVVDCGQSGEVVGSARKFSLITVDRAPTSGAGWIASTGRALFGNAGPAQDMPL